MVKNLPASVGDVGLTPGSERSPGEGNVNPLQYSCLGNPMDRGAWWATGHGVAKSLDLATEHARTPATFQQAMQTLKASVTLLTCGNS